MFLNFVFNSSYINSIVTLVLGGQSISMLNSDLSTNILKEYVFKEAVEENLALACSHPSAC